MEKTKAIMDVTYTKQFREKNGITLIALIITIIVMLILVGVTINFAINGGIINKAKTASSDYQIEADRETLQLAVIASMDYLTDEINDTELKANLTGWTVTGNGPYTCVSPNKNSYSVTKAGVITKSGEEPNESEEIEDPLDYYTNPNFDKYADLSANESDYIFGLGITKEGRVLVFQNMGNNVTAMPSILVWYNSLGHVQVVDSYTAEFNGQTLTYENAIVSIKSDGNVLLGYIDSNNEITILDPEYTESSSNIDENGNIIEYTKLDEIITIQKSNFITADEVNLNVYETNVEGGKELVGLNSDFTKVYSGQVYTDDAYLNSQNLTGLKNIDLWMIILDCIKLDTYTATMQDNSTKTYNNVIMATQRFSDSTIHDGECEPIGYLDGNRFIPFDCQYNLDSSNRDENGYPIVYTELEPSTTKIYTKR